MGAYKSLEEEMMKRLAVFLMFVAAVGLAEVLLTDTIASESFTVIDGDSLRAGAEDIRLQDIDAPEFLQECYDADNKKYDCGQAALRHLRKLVREGISCQRLGKDRYKRSLAECYLSDGKCINQQMVADGWAVAYGEKYKTEENAARAAKKGIWQGKFMRPELFRALQRRRQGKQSKKM